MPSTYTSLLRLTLPADGELIGTWGQVVNNGITTLEESAIAGTSSIVLADANRTLTTANGATDEARNMVIVFTGALTAQRDIIVPTSSKIYFVRNGTTGGFGLNVKTSAGTGVVVPAGAAMLVYCNGTNVVAALSTVTGAAQFLLADGTAAAPSLSFVNDTNTGMFLGSADALGFATGGLVRQTLDGNGSLSMAAPTNASAPTVVLQSAAGAFTLDLRGRASDDLTVIRLLNTGYTTQRATFQCDNANGYVGTVANLPFSILQNGSGRLGFDTAGNSSFSGTVFGTNFFIGASTTSAGTYGVSGSVGASMVTWGNTAAGGGRFDIYTGGGAAAIFPKFASAVNYFELNQSTANVPLTFNANGASTNVGLQYITKGLANHDFYSHLGAAQLQVSILGTASTSRVLYLKGGVGDNPGIGVSGGEGVKFYNSSLNVIGGSRPWSGSIAESQGYIYNVALGQCNMTASANNRIHEWYKDSTALYGLWISDTGGAAAQWVKATGGQAAGTTAIEFNTVTMNISVTTGGLNLTGSATSNGTLAITDTGGAGVNIKMTGDGGTTPKKFLRVTGGSFQIINDGYTAALISATDAGVLTDIRGLALMRDPGTTGSAHAVGSVVMANIGAVVTNAFATINAATNNLTVHSTGAGTNATINTGTWRNCGARDTSTGFALWMRTA